MTLPYLAIASPSGMYPRALVQPPTCRLSPSGALAWECAGACSPDARENPGQW